MTSGHGLQFQLRPTAGVDSQYSTNVQNSPNTTEPSEAWMRVQRVGNDVSTYHSQDGKNWTVASLTLTIPNLPQEALIGIAATSHEQGTLASATFDNVSLQPGALLVHGIKACGANQSVVMEWKPIEGAESYNVYRAAASETDITKFVKVTDQVIAGTTYTDASAGLVNGTAVAYLIAPVKKDADGNSVEGDRVRFSATPDAFTVVAPPGFATLSTNEGVECGVGPSFNPDTGEITIRGSGGDIWDAADRYNFTHQEVEGNFQVTVKALTKPTHTNDWSKAGLMIRESLAPGSRDAYFVLTALNGLTFQYREETDGGAAWGGSAAIVNDDLQPPLMIRMTREGDLITGEYSLDDGKTWEYGGEIELPDLEAKVDVGLAITSHNSGVISEAKFQNLEVKKL
jgi:regulation of enolase protein 1 (concanavalin A-like superfamily)